MLNILFYKIIVFFQWACILASFICALKIVKDRKLSFHMKGFFFYPFIAAFNVIFNLFYTYFDITSKLVHGIINNSLILFHFIFLSLFIYTFLPNKKISKYIIFIFFSFIAVILFFLFTKDISERQPTAFAISNLGLVIFCFVYYFQLFELMPKINLLAEPSFWIVNGIFFCMCATIPTLALKAYLLEKISQRIYSTVEAIIPFAYGMMHLFFIKAYLCSIKQSRVS